ncbi:hypothetical protein EMCG_01111 [[Emmonsia] crescens]|uniref:Uncharacterized protein n=1 Tax=[Emmonsia] crescens TaxID=73230 RepID=A0A0G2JBC5_9EURO|nr:hypothetical protein EMCG_01111 [Emmonsia crescens UAMH 3008]
MADHPGSPIRETPTIEPGAQTVYRETVSKEREQRRERDGGTDYMLPGKATGEAHYQPKNMERGLYFISPPFSPDTHRRRRKT